MLGLFLVKKGPGLGPFFAIFWSCQGEKGPQHMFSRVCGGHMAHQSVSIWFG